MAWQIEFEESAAKELAQLDRAVARRILVFLKQRIAGVDSPRRLGQAIKGERHSGLWKYRVGDYRIICKIKDDAIEVLVIKIGHRKQVYQTK